MKKLLLILSLCLALGCKKKNDDANVDITKYTWPLESAIVNPAIQVNGVTVTNFKTAEDNSSCINSNYTLRFSANGSYAFTSTGALCDMISFEKAKWTKSGNEITLNSGYGNDQIVILNGKTITQKQTFERDGKTHTVTYLFVAKSK